MFRRVLLHLVILIVAFNLISFVREANMLSSDEINLDKPHQLSTLMAKTVDLTAQGKTTVLYFFAPWCTVCHHSIDNLQSIYLKNMNIEVIAVALDYENEEEVRKFSQQHQLTFPIALGNSKVKSDFKVMGYPSYYVLDENNDITAKSLGYSTELGLYLRTL